MKDIVYDTQDKRTWPRGVWDDEPDKKQWRDEATGYPCLIVRNQSMGRRKVVGRGKKINGASDYALRAASDKCQVPDSPGNFFSTSRAKRLAPMGKAASLKS